MMFVDDISGSLVCHFSSYSDDSMLIFSGADDVELHRYLLEQVAKCKDMNG